MNNIQKEALLKKRYNAEKRFKLYGILSIFLAISFLFILIFNIIILLRKKLGKPVLMKF